MRTLDEILEQMIISKYHGRLLYDDVEAKKEQFVADLLRILENENEHLHSF